MDTKKQFFYVFQKETIVNVNSIKSCTNTKKAARTVETFETTFTDSFAFIIFLFYFRLTWFRLLLLRLLDIFVPFAWQM